jgi:hypothetical protein
MTIVILSGFGWAQQDGMAQTTQPGASKLSVIHEKKNDAGEEVLTFKDGLNRWTTDTARRCWVALSSLM